MNRSKLIISIGTDHAAHLKAPILIPEDRGPCVIDYGCQSETSCDYPGFIRPAAEAVASGQSDYGIMLGGSVS